MAYTTTLKIGIDRCCYLILPNDEQNGMKQKKKSGKKVTALTIRVKMPLTGERKKKSNHNQMNAHISVVETNLH